MIKTPPSKCAEIDSVFEYIQEKHPDHIMDYLDYYRVVDSKGQYHHFDKLRHRIPNNLNSDLAWFVVKSARRIQYKNLLTLGQPGQRCKFILTPTMQKAVSMTDRNATSASLELMSSKIGEEQHLKYLLNDLIEDEAISSSQLEGAATTTKVAKDMLKRKRKPRNADERMIVGNFRMMQYAWNNRHQDLTLDLIKEIHLVGVDGIDDDEYTPGEYRKTDDVYITDRDYNVLHTPPPARTIKKRLESICNWINTCHDNAETSNYIHPLIKACALHFSIGYEHPFRDGNGRVARALFYWLMFKSDYAAFRYIAISVLLKNSPTQYGKSYLYTESDEMDLTYFIDYQCSIVIKAISEFKTAYNMTLKETEEFNNWLWNSGLYKELSDKQKTIFHVAKGGTQKVFTISIVKDNLDCSYNTAANALNDLVNKKIFIKEKVGREWYYQLKPKEDIKKSWKAN